MKHAAMAKPPPVQPPKGAWLGWGREGRGAAARLADEARAAAQLMPTYGLQANASFPLGTCAFQARARPPTPARCLPMPLQKPSPR
jgi:hypothetical protein